MPRAPTSRGQPIERLFHSLWGKSQDPRKQVLGIILHIYPQQSSANSNSVLRGRQGPEDEWPLSERESFTTERGQGMSRSLNVA